jgi:hypothetical protein
MVRGLDYDVDYAASTITFANPVTDLQVIRIEYVYNPQISTQISSPSSVPISYDVLKLDATSVQVVGVYKPSAANAQSGLTVLGMNGATKVGSESVSTTLLFSPTNPGTTGQPETSFLDQAAMKFGVDTKTKNFQLSTSFVHVGDQFNDAGDYKLQQGVDVLNVSTTYTASKTLNLVNSYSSSESLMAATLGATTTTLTNGATYAPSAASKLTFTHTQVDTSQPGVAGSQTITDNVQINQALGSKASALASYVTTSATTNGTQSDTATGQIVYDAKGKNNTTLHTSFTQTDTSASGSSTATDQFVLDTTGKNNTTLHTSFTQTDTSASGSSNDLELKLQTQTSKTTTVAATVSQTNSTTAGTDAVAVSVTAPKNTTVGVNWNDSSSQTSAYQESGTVHIDTSPSKTLKLSGAVGETDNDGSHDLTQQANLQLTPLKDTTVIGGYSETDSNGNFSTRAVQVAASAKPISVLQLSGGYISRSGPQNDLDTTNLGLTLNTGRLIQLTGSYVMNPQDKSGTVQQANSRTFGLITNFGKLKMNGAYTVNDQYMAGMRDQKTQVGMDLRISANATLSTSYSLDQCRQGGLLETSVYSLGLTHKVGDTFNFYLGGNMTVYENSQAVSQDPDYKAEARLGIKY